MEATGGKTEAQRRKAPGVPRLRKAASVSDVRGKIAARKYISLLLHIHTLLDIQN